MLPGQLYKKDLLLYMYKFFLGGISYKILEYFLSRSLTHHIMLM